MESGLDKLRRQREQAIALRDAGKLEQAANAMQTYLTRAPNDREVALVYGDVLMRLERFDGAVTLYAKWIEKDSRDAMILSNFGAALLRQGRPADAKSILEYALEVDPKNLYARINLGGVYQSLGDLNLALKNALDAVSIDPTQALTFNNLGSAFSDLAKFEEAKHAYETAVMLDPKSVDALINLATSESKLGNSKEAIRRFEEVIRRLPKEAKHRREAVEFFASFQYLVNADLEKGWAYYEGGFSPLVPLAGARAPNRVFKAPRWRGENIEGKSLLVWREQGIGDELLFATALHELESTGARIIMEADPRFVETFARSFPSFVLRAQAFNPLSFESVYCDFDLQIPIGSLMRIYRSKLEDFERNRPFIVVDPDKKIKFMERLAPYREKKLVGFCWRSGRLDPVRNLDYTMIDDWAEVVSMRGYEFVNLQYGECEQELQRIEMMTSRQIIRWNDLNLKDDLDDVFALMSCLDYVVSVGTAVFPMAGACGKPALLLGGAHWATLGSDHHYPFFPAARISGMLPGAAVAGELPKVAGLLRDESFWHSL